MKVKLQAFNRVFVTAFDWKRQKHDIFGSTNRCYGLGYIIYLDYDGLELDWITAELMEMQELFGLSHFYVFETNHGYHAVCFDKVSLLTYVEVLKNSSADINFIDVPLKYGKKVWTLRWSEKDGEKPKFVRAVLSTRCNRNKSKAHIDFVEKMYPELIGKIDREAQDKSDKIILSNYKI